MNFLLIGKKPPPIGGVTIHVKRLLEHLNYNCFRYTFLDLSSKKKPFNILLKICKADCIHLHTSNVYLQLSMAIWCRIFSTYLLVTYHGSLGRYGAVKNYLTFLSVKLCDVPLVLNSNSYIIGKKWNVNCLIISAYIPPSIEERNVDSEIENLITHMSKQFRYCFVTNAYNYALDSNGSEIYGIELLLDVFSEVSDSMLVISDPSGNYTKLFGKRINRMSNVLIFSKTHSFFSLFPIADCVIRATSTDGDSISVKEALAFGIDVLASNCVDRPMGVRLFSIGDFKKLSDIVRYFEPSRVVFQQVNGGTEVLLIYRKICRLLSSNN